MKRREEKRWVPKDENPKSPPKGIEEKASVEWQRPSSDRSGHKHLSSSGNSSHYFTFFCHWIFDNGGF